MKREKLYDKALTTYGTQPQLIVAIEEMAELTKEIAKSFRGELDIEKVSDEIADVEIMLEQIKHHYRLKYAVMRRKEYKKKRLEKRLK